MKIAMPISSVNEIKPLLDYKPDEFYCGINVGNGTCNRREMESANLSSYQELKEIVKISHKNGIKVSFTLNAQVYTPNQITFLKKEIQKLSKIKIDNIITSNLSIMDYIKTNYPDIKIFVSSVVGLFNSEAINVFKELGVARIILPRDVTMNEIRDIKNNCDIEIEVFIMGWKCKNMDSHCAGFHDVKDGKPLANFCCLDYKIDSKTSKIAKKIEMSFQNTWITSERGCGGCKIQELEKMGIERMKIVGRRLPLKQKIDLLSFINHARDLNIPDIQKLHKKQLGYDCSTKYCYYSPTKIY